MRWACKKPVRLVLRHDSMLAGFRAGELQVWWWRQFPRRLWTVERVNGYLNIGPFEFSWGRP